LDSAAAFYALGKPTCLYIGGLDGPARSANRGEMVALLTLRELSQEFNAKLVTMQFDFSPFMREGAWRFPREMILCQLAWAAGFDEVMIAWVKDDGATEDWTRQQAANFAASVGMAGFKVSFPVAHLTKRELLAKARVAGMPLGFAESTHSCVRSSDPCGLCENCTQREAALV
jgi:hypothetical protein